jgi:hypothetical protein
LLCRKDSRPHYLLGEIAQMTVSLVNAPIFRHVNSIAMISRLADPLALLPPHLPRPPPSLVIGLGLAAGCPSWKGMPSPIQPHRPPPPGPSPLHRILRLAHHSPMRGTLPLAVCGSTAS